MIYCMEYKVLFFFHLHEAAKRIKRTKIMKIKSLGNKYQLDFLLFTLSYKLKLKKGYFEEN